jgi:predicted Ser/Thr protein kinase
MSPTPANHPPEGELRAFADGGLTPAAADRLAGHLAGCPACAAFVADLTPPLLAAVRHHLLEQPPGSGVDSGVPGAHPDGVGDPVVRMIHQHTPFRVVREVGGGAMGRVYEAEDWSHGRRVALKVIAPSRAIDAAFVRRFESEARALRFLRHPNVVEYVGTHRAGDHLMIVMEYVRGQNLQEVLADRGRLPPATAAAYVLQILKALDYLSDRGIVHRDLKPANCVLTPAGVVKVVDFGLAKDTLDPRSLALTGFDALLGTPAYMAPEQAERPNRADSRSDLYSVGCIFYHLLTGRPPFHADTIQGALVAHKTEAPVPPHRRTPAVPKPLSRIVLRMLEKDPGRRFGAPREALLAVARYAEPAAPTGIRRSPKRYLAPAAAAAVVGALAGSIWLVLPDQVGEPAPPQPPPGVPGDSAPARGPRTTASGSSWTKDGILTVRGGGGRHVVMYGSETWSDYIFEVEAQFVAGHEGPVLYFLATDRDYQSLSVGALGGRYLTLSGSEGGAAMPEPVQVRFPIERGRWYQVRIDTRGQRFDCTVDRARPFQDLLPVRFSRGQIGVGAETGCECLFRHLVVKRPDGTRLWSGP